MGLDVPMSVPVQVPSRGSLYQGVLVDTTQTILAIAHSIGAILVLVGAIGTWIKGAKSFRAIMVWSARFQVLSGVVLAILAFIDDEANPAKLAVKLLIALAVAGLAESAARRDVRAPIMAAIVVLTVAN